jgi:hypothetical protein
MVGADGAPEPDGPQSGTPAVLVPRRCSGSVMSGVFQMTAPTARRAWKCYGTCSTAQDGTCAS